MVYSNVAMELAQQPVTIDHLNPPQADAVAHVDGPLIVFAGAGSGKTRVITYRIANLLATHRVPPYRILAVTFTNKAAQEMVARLDRIVGHEITRDLWVGTFHAVCARLLRRHHEAAGIGASFVVYDDSDQKAVMNRIVKELQLDERRFPPQQVLARIHKAKQEAVDPDGLVARDYFDEIVRRCYTLYEERLRAANACDFDDLLLHVLRLVEKGDGEVGDTLRRKFWFVLVDEFQDVNQVQYRLVRALASERRNICVVGDDDQSIYRWRGADVRNIRGFTRDYPEAKLVKLEENYRSSQNIVRAALEVIRPARDRQPKELWTSNPEGDPVTVAQTASERDEAAWVVGRLKRLIAEGVSPRDIAIFYRVHAQSRVLEEVMRSENVPYQIIGGHKFFDRAEIKDLLGYLRLIVNPQSDVDLVRVINQPPRKIGKSTVDRLLEVANEESTSAYDAIVPLCASDRVGSAAKKSLRAFDELMQSFMLAAVTASPRELCERVLLETGYGEWLQKQDNSEADARLDNLRELLGSIEEYELDRAAADEPATLTDYLARVTLMSDADTMQDVPRVPMMTVHAAKGLEFHAVFITGMEERLFPLRGDQPGEREELEEERRLAYVALTRARKQLHVTHTNVRTIYGQIRYNQPSRFLGDIPGAVVRQVITEAVKDLGRSYGGMRSGTVEERPWRRPWDEEEARPLASLAGPARAEGERFIERDDDYDAPDDGEGGSLCVGGRVRHAKFGVGQLIELGRGPDPTATVKFPGWPQKQIKLRFLAPA